MSTHPQRNPGEVFLGYHHNSLMRLSVLPGIRQCTEGGEFVSLTGNSNGHFSSTLATFAPIEEIRRIQRQARGAGGTPFDLNVLDPNFQA